MNQKYHSLKEPILIKKKKRLIKNEIKKLIKLEKSIAKCKNNEYEKEKKVVEVLKAVSLVKNKYADPNDLDSFKEENYSQIERYHEKPNPLCSTFEYMGIKSPKNYSNNGSIEPTLDEDIFMAFKREKERKSKQNITLL